MVNKSNGANTTLLLLQSSSISHVCFSITVVCYMLHLGLIVCVRNLKYIYGLPLSMSLFMNTVGFVTWIVSCFLRKNVSNTQIISATWPEVASQSLFLSAISWNLVAIIQTMLLCRFSLFSPSNAPRRFSELVSSGHQLLAFVGRLFCFLFGLSFALGLPLALAVWRILSKPAHQTSHPIFDSKYHEFECSLTKTSILFATFLTPLILLVLLQCVCSVCTLLYVHRKQHQQQNHQQPQPQPQGIHEEDNNEDLSQQLKFKMDPEFSLVMIRCKMTLKLSLSYCLVWVVGSLALIFSEAALWHLFTLVCALQSLFITVSFIFTRPVLMTINNCHRTDPGYVITIRPSLNHIHRDS